MPPPPPLQSLSLCLLITCSRALLFFLLVPTVIVDSSSHSDTGVGHRRSCLVPLSQQGCPPHCQQLSSSSDPPDLSSCTFNTRALGTWSWTIQQYSSQVLSVAGSTGCISQSPRCPDGLFFSATSTYGCAKGTYTQTRSHVWCGTEPPNVHGPLFRAHYARAQR